MNTLGVISLLHEPATDNSATRLFRDQPVLFWTLARLAAVEPIKQWTILCWSDQVEAVTSCTGSTPTHIHDNGPRHPIPSLDSLTTATRWLDAWRGGLLQTSDIDPGFHAPTLLQLATGNSQLATPPDSLFLVDPSSALIDPHLILSTLNHAELHPDQPLIFTPSAPGLNGTLLRTTLLQQLAPTQSHPGRLLAYLQDAPGKDPLARPCCAPVPTKVARTTKRFKLDTLRQVHRLTQEMAPFNGQLLHTHAEDLVRQSESNTDLDPLPRELTLELTTTRNTNPLWSPLRYTQVTRPNLDPSTAACLFAELSEYPDTRITFAGLGDPLLHPDLDQIILSAHNAGLRALHLETDLVGIPPARITTLSSLPLDLITLHIPAYTQPTYAKMMGTDAYLELLDNLKTLVTARAALGRGVPLIVPTFTKCRDNLHEMEPWYDQWLRVLGSAVITAPSPHANTVPAESIGIPHMTPPNRRPCSRLSTRITLRSDGSLAQCEQTLPIGAASPAVSPEAHFPTQPIKQLWASLNPLRTQHAQGTYPTPCTTCPEWHRP